MAEISVFISTSVFAKNDDLPIKILQQEGFKYQLNPLERRLTPDETIQFLQDKDAVISGTEEYSKEVIAQLPRLKVISRCGAGIDGINIEELQKRGIVLLRTDEVHVQSVAELTIGAMIALSRKIPQHHFVMQNKKWQRWIGNDIANSVVGIVGFGKVGQRVAKLLTFWGCKIIVYDLNFPPQLPQYVSSVIQPEELWKRSDIITFHIPLTQGTRNFVDAKVFNLLKNDVKLINTSRGEIFSEGDLEYFLVNNPDASVFFDVFWEEPYQGRLLSLPNFISTPHIGTFTYQTRQRMEVEAVMNLINFFKNR